MKYKFLKIKLQCNKQITKGEGSKFSTTQSNQNVSIR